MTTTTTETHAYIVRTANYYGAGATMDEAKSACIAAGGGFNIKAHGFTCHRVTGDWAINEIDGTLTATGEIEKVTDASTGFRARGTAIDAAAGPEIRGGVIRVVARPMTTRERDRAHRGDALTSALGPSCPPAPGERCPRCHRRDSVALGIPCALCNPIGPAARPAP